MHRSYDYHPNHHYGWDTTSQEYVEHVSRVERTPDMVTDLPRFPNLYKLYDGHARDKNAICQEQHEDHLPRLNHHKHQSPEAGKKVHFVEQEIKNTTDVEKKEKTKVQKEYDVNMAADGFINQNRKNFSLYKWATFKSV